MRLFLLPISTRRTLIYCERLHVLTAKDQGYLDKATTKASALWASWEQKDSGWQKKVVEYGSQALKRIPYEEWGLKSIPPLSTRRKEEELSGAEKVEVHFPSNLIPEATVMTVLKTLGTERQQLHKTRIIGSVVGMPIVAPFALVPVYVTLLELPAHLSNTLIAFPIYHFSIWFSGPIPTGRLSEGLNTSNSWLIISSSKLNPLRFSMNSTLPANDHSIMGHLPEMRRWCFICPTESA